MLQCGLHMVIFETTLIEFKNICGSFGLYWSDYSWNLVNDIQFSRSSRLACKFCNEIGSWMNNDVFTKIFSTKWLYKITDLSFYKAITVVRPVECLANFGRFPFCEWRGCVFSGRPASFVIRLALRPFVFWIQKKHRALSHLTKALQRRTCESAAMDIMQKPRTSFAGAWWGEWRRGREKRGRGRGCPCWMSWSLCTVRAACSIPFHRQIRCPRWKPLVSNLGEF